MKIMPEALAALAGQALACIDEEVVIEKILAHVDAQVLPSDAVALPATRAPPQLEIDDDWQ